MAEKLTYKDSGVDIEKGDHFVKNITALVKSTYNSRVKSGIGGFAALYDMGGGKLLSSSTDGVGTKLKIAQILDVHHTIGIDLVAMCVNDLICNGSRPHFFLDYLATGKLELKTGQDILKGIVAGCKQAGCALMGGETAEMPGMYAPGEYDLAGFSVGEVNRKKVIDGKKIKVGTTLIGLPSSGFHSNGYSLVRKLIRDDERELLTQALTPTRIYVKLVLDLLQKFPRDILGISNITGSGLLNIPRMNTKFSYQLTALPELGSLAPVMQEVIKRSGPLTGAELYSTWNMGIGLVLAVKNPQKIMAHLKKKKEKAFIMGQVIKGKGAVEVNSGPYQFSLS